MAVAMGMLLVGAPAAPLRAAEQARPISRSAVSLTGQPKLIFPQGKDYVVTGYRGASFGMTEAEVRDAIARDFGDVTVTTGSNSLEGTRTLTVTVSSLPPGDGPAAVSYVFGSATERLITINTVWRTAADADAAARDKLVEIAATAAGEFLGYRWKLFTTARGIPARPNALIVFAGGDEAGGGVEVALDGIQYAWSASDGRTGMGPLPRGPAVLRIAYTANLAKPDISRLQPGSF